MGLVQMHSWEREEDLRHVSLNYKLNIIHEHVFSLVIISQFDQGFLTSHKLVDIINYLIPPPCFLMNTFVIYETEVFLNFMVKNNVLFMKQRYLLWTLSMIFVAIKEQTWNKLSAAALFTAIFMWHFLTFSHN